MLGSPHQARGDLAITAHSLVALAFLMVLGGLLPLTMAGGVPAYAAVFSPGSDALQAIAQMSRAGAGWRLLRVVASHPVPILLVAQTGQGGAAPAALLLPVPAEPACRSVATGR